MKLIKLPPEVDGTEELEAAGGGRIKRAAGLFGICACKLANESSTRKSNVGTWKFIKVGGA
ncbi:hypothetical protein [Prosthecobacter sp.]|uniref:hypothetical protein n=1 Tax=Prosthecobacter sp. TaxID=1965333 RepID=UPI003782FFDB